MINTCIHKHTINFDMYLIVTQKGYIGKLHIFCKAT